MTLGTGALAWTDWGTQLVERPSWVIAEGLRGLGLLHGPKTNTFGQFSSHLHFLDFVILNLLESPACSGYEPTPGLGESPISLIGVLTCLPCPPGQRILILEDLGDAEVQEGSSATFSCRVSPADYGPVHWFLDKTPLYVNELNEIKAQPGGYHVLILRQLALKDSGTIHFEAGDQRSSATLRVTGGLHAVTGAGPCGRRCRIVLGLTEKAPWAGTWIPGWA